MDNLVNLTPHTINIVSDIVVDIPPSGVVARVSTFVEMVGSVAGIPLHKTTFGIVQDLPDPVDNVLYIVSALVKSACPDRTDLVSPSSLVRDAAGRVIGCSGLTF